MRQCRVAIAVTVVLLLAGCTAIWPAGGTSPSGTGAVQPVGAAVMVASGLASPWSMLPLATGSTLVSERDTGIVREVTDTGEVRMVGTVPGVVHEGEGGLLGLEIYAGVETIWLYAYLTTASDNRIERFELIGTPGEYSLGRPVPVLTGIAKAANHNGGRIRFGPDGMLYATVGDAGDATSAQDPDSLNGKILRMTPAGGIPVTNPFPRSLVYSLGHRNPQGLDWDASGQLWAAEFGQDTWDELNRIVPGGNYGWPIVEGIAHKAGYIDPDYQWKTTEASPSGLVWIHGTFFLAALRGECVWAIHPGQGATDPVAWFTGDFGRIRDVAAGPDDTLWLLTNNTDGRGEPREGDDQIIQVKLERVGQG